MRYNLTCCLKATTDQRLRPKLVWLTMTMTIAQIVIIQELWMNEKINKLVL